MEINLRVEQAIDAVQTHVHKSLKEAAAAFHVPESTVIHRAAGRLPRPEAHESPMLLTVAEEEVLTE